MSAPRSVMLAVATRGRPEGLARLLAAVARLTPPAGVAFRVLVVDNSAAGAEARRWAGAAFPHPLEARHEPRRGLSAARNAALAGALGSGVEALAFLDDDEEPAPGWLDAHLAALAATGAAASLGAVRARHAAPPPAWVAAGGFLDLSGPARHAEMPFGATSNILFRLAPVVRTGLRFDPAYDLTGGEDTAFFAAYRAAGGRIVFAPDALAWEDVAPARATLGWLWRRWRRTGQTSARLLIARRGRGAALGGGALRLAAGLALWAAALPLARAGRPALWARGARICARGAGFVDAARGRLTAEYGAPDG